jgi:cyclic pyranopterin phosphate synthase
LLYDNYGRPALNLRVSLTQRCNLKCPYCHREGQPPESDAREMTADEVVNLVRIAIYLGISHVKLTGGEPLLREDIVDIVSRLAKIDGLKDLSMTTNGIHLASFAESLHKAGLKRVNINIVSLNPKTYYSLSGGHLRDALDGVNAAVRTGFYPVKLNYLLLHGVNEHEVYNMMAFAEKSGIILQLLELEPIKMADPYFRRYHYSLDGIEKELEKKALSIKVRSKMQNRRVFSLPNLKVEIVRPLENSEFCSRCTRLRLTSNGFLKPCLMVFDNLVDVLTPLRNGASDEKIKKLFVEAVKRRKPYFQSS